MHRLNKDFDRVICINLVERKDKKEESKLRFDSLGINVEWFNPVKFDFIPKIINPIVDSKIGNFNKTQPYELGAFLSHYSVIKNALLNGCKKIFVFEDDCLFHKDFNNILPKYLDTIPLDADGILFYSFQYELLKENMRCSARWTKGFKSWSLLAYGMNDLAMKKYIEIADNQPQIADLISYKMMELGFNFYVASPPLVIPSKSYSDIRNIKNYEINKSVYLLGVDESLYI